MQTVGETGYLWEGRWLRCASGSGFDPWSLAGGIGSLTIAAAVHLLTEAVRNRNQTKKEAAMHDDGTKQTASHMQRVRYYLYETAGAAAGEVGGSLLAS